MSQKITYAELPFLCFAAITNDIHKAQINLRFRFSYLRFRKIKENYMLNFHAQKSNVVFLIHTFFHALNVATRLNSCLESLCNYSQVITPFHLRYHVHQNLLHNTISSKEAEQEVTWDRCVCVCVLHGHVLPVHYIILSFICNSISLQLKPRLKQLLLNINFNHLKILRVMMKTGFLNPPCFFCTLILFVTSCSYSFFPGTFLQTTWGIYEVSWGFMCTPTSALILTRRPML